MTFPPRISPILGVRFRNLIEDLIRNLTRATPLLALALLAPSPSRGQAPAALAQAEAQESRVQVSILPIELSSDDREVSLHAKRRIQEGLRDVLHGSGRYRLVERSNPEILERILKELKFQNQGLVASQEAKSLGNLAGIDVFVRAQGELTVGWTRCSLRLKVAIIDVETSKLLEMHEVQGKGRASLDPDASADSAVAAAMYALTAKLDPR